MIKYGDGYWIKRVLKKLYDLHLEDRLRSVGHPWDCDFDYALSVEENRINFNSEIKALEALSNMYVVEFDVVGTSLFINQNNAKPLTGAAKYFDETPTILNFSPKRFTDYCRMVQFNPSEANDPTYLSPVIASMGDFTAHEDGSVRYSGRPMGSLKPQQTRLVNELIAKKGGIVSRDQIKDALWDADDENNFAARQTTTEPMVTKRIGSIVSDINKRLYSRGDKKHVICKGDASYSFIE